MKNIKFILAAFVAVFISLATVNMYAQEDGNRDANGYVVKGPYLTNGGGANWFIGFGGGVNTSLARGVVPFHDFAIENNWGAEAFIGKWFTPTVGARVGYKGVMNNFGYDTDTYFSERYPSGEQVRFGYVHGDFMWNLSNALGGYKETRFWDIIPYAGGGYLGINNGITDNKFAASVGVYNEFRLGKCANLFVDVNIIGTENPLKLHKLGEDGVADVNTPVITHPLYMPTATIGVTFNISRKKNFDRYSTVAPPALPFTLSDYNDLVKKIGVLEKENADLRDFLANAQGTPADTVYVAGDTRVLVGSTVITFPIGKSRLSKVEREKVQLFAESFTENDTLIHIVGSADSKTGTEKGNYKLAQKRADTVRDALVKYGIAEDRISVDTVLDATEDPETSRSAIITLTVE